MSQANKDKSLEKTINQIIEQKEAENEALKKLINSLGEPDQEKQKDNTNNQSDK